jgi:hypothetical protein
VEHRVDTHLRGKFEFEGQAALSDLLQDLKRAWFLSVWFCSRALALDVLLNKSDLISDFEQWEILASGVVVSFVGCLDFY